MEQLPAKSAILQWLSENPTLSSKRDIARAFGIKGGAMRIELKRMLKELEDEGALAKKRRSYRDPDSLPPVSILRVEAPDSQGDLFARAVEWTGEGDPPRIR
jgi:ribonuclease R